MMFHAGFQPSRSHAKHECVRQICMPVALPVIHSDDSIFRFHFTLTEHKQLEWIDHGHLFTRYSASTNLRKQIQKRHQINKKNPPSFIRKCTDTYLFPKHEEWRRKSLLSVGAVHWRLVDQRSLAFCCQHLSFLAVNTNIGVHTQTQQSYNLEKKLTGYHKAEC